MRPTILLFDVDGTLVTTGGAGRRALERVFAHCFGREDACSFRLDGMTDRAIVRAGLASIGISATEQDIDAVLADYVRILEEEVAGADASQYRLHRGIQEALDAARGRAQVALGLGTGNIREGARIKLSRVGIYERFAFGGFGCDHEERVELIRCGAARGAERLGVSLKDCRVVVIGDTPNDITAAQGIRAESVGVGTGRFGAAELLAAGATAAFADLSAQGALETLLGESA
jgi:phosphoglycolate phosphatase-like HAD superfamily hydrolase